MDRRLRISPLSLFCRRRRAFERAVRLAGDDAEPFILRINATAGVFAAALEEVVAAGVGPDVAAAATAILERGFPAQEDAQL